MARLQGILDVREIESWNDEGKEDEEVEEDVEAIKIAADTREPDPTQVEAEPAAAASVSGTICKTRSARTACRGSTG